MRFVVFMCLLREPSIMSAVSDVGWGFFGFGVFVLILRILVLLFHGCDRILTLQKFEVNFLTFSWSEVWVGMGLALLITSSNIVDNPCPNNCARVDFNEANLVTIRVFGSLFIIIASAFYAYRLIMFCYGTLRIADSDCIFISLASLDYLLISISICLLGVDGSLGSCPSSCPPSTPRPG